MEKAWKLVLGLFGEGASGGAGAEGGTTGEGAGQLSGGQTSDPAADRKAQFREMIKGDYKAEYDEVMQENFKRRFKEHDELKKRVDDTRPLMELLASKYGVDAGDIAGIVKAAEADDGYYEEEAAEKGLTVQQLKDIKRMERENAQLKAAEKGLTVQQLKDIKRMERENAQLKAAAEERQRVEGVNRVHAQWAQESEALKAIYPEFDFDAETRNPAFSDMLLKGVSVEAAYKAVHFDEMMTGMMQFTAQKAREQTVNDIRARGMRPDEGGMGNRAAGEAKLDVSKLTKAERAAIAERAIRGERIDLR